MAAVGVKELRGRMRGKRAFVILTIHLLLVAGFAWMIESLAERTYHGRLRLHVLGVVRDRPAAVHGDPALPADAHHAGPRAGLHRRRDQPGAREADARPADHDADLVAGDHPGQAPLRAVLDPAAAARVDPGRRPRLHVRRRGPGRRGQGATSCCWGRRSPTAPIGLFVSALVRRTQAATVINLVGRHRPDRGHRVHLHVLDRDDRQQRRPPRPERGPRRRPPRRR